MKVIETPAAIGLQHSDQDNGKNVAVQERRLRSSHDKNFALGLPLMFRRSEGTLRSSYTERWGFVYLFKQENFFSCETR